MRKAACVLLLLLLVAGKGQACWRQHPEQREILQEHGLFKAVVTPCADWGRGEEAPTITVYKRVSGDWEEHYVLTAVNPVAPSSVRISADGRFVVTYGNWGGSEKDNDVFVIYDHGVLVAQFSVAEVIGPGRDLETRQRAERALQRNRLINQMQPQLEQYYAEEQKKREAALGRKLSEDEIEELRMAIDIDPDWGVIIADEVILNSAPLSRIKPLLDQLESLNEYYGVIGRSYSTAGNNWLRDSRAFFFESNSFAFWLETEQVWSLFSLEDGVMLPITPEVENKLSEALRQTLRKELADDSRWKTSTIHLLGRFGQTRDIEALKEYLRAPFTSTTSCGCEIWNANRVAAEKALAKLENAASPGEPPAIEGYRYHGSLVVTFPTPDEFRESIESSFRVTLHPRFGDQTEIPLYVNGLTNLYRGEQPIPATIRVGIHTLPPGQYGVTCSWQGQQQTYQMDTPVEMTVEAGKASVQAVTLSAKAAQ